MPQFDTRVHHVDPVTMRVIKETHYRCVCIGDSKVYEQPPGSGLYWHEDGSRVGEETLIALGLKKPAPVASPAANSVTASLSGAVAMNSEATEEKPARKKPGRKPGTKAQKAKATDPTQDATASA